MALQEVEFNIGVAIGLQSGLGSVNTTIANLTAGGGSGTAGAIDESDGAVLGDPSGGQGESGVDIVIARELREKAFLTGSFTRQPSDFLAESLDTFSLLVAAKGNGATISGTPSGSEYQPAPGIDGLLQCGGLVGAASGNSWLYKPAAQQFVTAKVWIGAPGTDQSAGQRAVTWVLQDVAASTIDLSQPPGETGVFTFTLAGTVYSFDEVEFPEFDYGNQSVTSAPTIESVNHTYGMTVTSGVRGFGDCTITIDNEAEDIADSNAPGGVRTRQTGRTITNSLTLFTGHEAATDLRFERDQLVKAIGLPDGPQTWTVGSAAGSTETALGYSVNFAYPEVRSMQPEKGGPSLQWNLELVAVNAAVGSGGTGPNEEFSLAFI